ncbi:MAG: hypothetical protein JO159_16525 [Acidobacteria bacterium]|nr:hypothetical protein [Acidobacteriota bacterium]MBV9625925.1 hypothetical protein [Acidobacteriota bacterium]
MSRFQIPSAILACAVATALCLSAPLKASADERSRCQHRVERAGEHYRHEARKHGKHSRSAERAKARLNAEWDHCWREAHGWYDPQRREWRTDRDWDRNYDWDR